VLPFYRSSEFVADTGNAVVINVSFERNCGSDHCLKALLNSLTADSLVTNSSHTLITISVLNSNFTISVILRFVNNPAISGGSIAFDKQSHMMVNFE